jgi:hypothetical protein
MNKTFDIKESYSVVGFRDEVDEPCDRNKAEVMIVKGIKGSNKGVLDRVSIDIAKELTLCIGSVFHMTTSYMKVK